MKRKRHHLLIGSSLALAFVVLALLGTAVRMVFDPPPVPCPLPALPARLPVAYFVWAPDSKRLLGTSWTGEGWIVDVPERGIEQLPAAPQPVVGCGWDRQAVPWLISPGGFARLRRDHREWDRFSVSAAGSTSPGGRWLTSIRAPLPSRRPGRPVLVVRALRRKEQPKRAQFVSERGDRYAWLDPDTLLIHRWGRSHPSPGLIKPSTGSVLELWPTTPSASQPEISYDDRDGPLERVYQWLSRELPALPGRSYQDTWLIVSDRTGRVLQRVSLGRRYASYGLNHWAKAKVSPDGRYVVLRAADDTLRILDLRAAEP